MDQRNSHRDTLRGRLAVSVRSFTTSRWCFTATGLETSSERGKKDCGGLHSDGKLGCGNLGTHQFGEKVEDEVARETMLTTPFVSVTVIPTPAIALPAASFVPAVVLSGAIVTSISRLTE
mmetsp:Transcript_42241/g.62567  ORF Transcript_42241/g.62567 Transcript_42241/m.62567 type:complete len:120 (+) Transcript_42241:521-880(+)